MSYDKISYDKATEKLVLLAQDYEVPQVGKYSLDEMVYLLRESFKNNVTFNKVFDMKLDRKGDPSAGFCLVSSYYIYEHTGGDKIWTLMASPSHWWLQHKIYSGPFDITYTQFSKPFDYHCGRPETKIYNDSMFAQVLRQKAYILGKQAGLE